MTRIASVQLLKQNDPNNKLRVQLLTFVQLLHVIQFQGVVGT